MRKLKGLSASEIITHSKEHSSPETFVPSVQTQCQKQSNLPYSIQEIFLVIFLKINEKLLNQTINHPAGECNSYEKFLSNLSGVSHLPVGTLYTYSFSGTVHLTIETSKSPQSWERCSVLTELGDYRGQISLGIPVLKIKMPFT